MPICSRCSVDQPRDAFTEESRPLCESCYEIELEDEFAGGAIGNDADQLAMDELEEAQRQQGQVMEEDNDNDNANNDDEKKNDENDKPRKVIDLSSVARIVNDMGELFDEIDDDAFHIGPPDIGLLELLVEAVHDRGYHDGFGLDSKEVLRHRLHRVLYIEEATMPVLTWLVRPLILVLIEGPNSVHMNVKIAPLNMKESVMEGQSLLHWLVQWKLLQIQCGWKGHDDMVDLLLRAGAPVDAKLQNGCTPLFFAVKYGSVDTVRLLHEAGANLQQEDCRKQTCLRNALPQASPYILKYLLDHGIKVDETFVAEGFDKSKNRINALDILVTEFVTPNPDVSWVTLGMASVDDYALCILLLLKRGLQISPHYYDVTYFLGHYLQGALKTKKRLFYTKRIADLFFGQWLPPAAKEELGVKVVTNDDDDHDDGDIDDKKTFETCGICLKKGENKTARESPKSFSVTLSCSHQFCSDCILQYAKNISLKASSSTKDAGCPTCHYPLGQDLLESVAETERANGGAKFTRSLDEERTKALFSLSMKQLQFECDARNLVVPDKENKEHLVASLVCDWQDFTVPNGRSGQGEHDGESGSRLMAELTLSNTMISEDNYLWVAPSLGSVMIPITVKGVPIFALVSTTSLYTVLSPRFVETFGFQVNHNLQRTLSKPLTFIRAEDDDQKQQADEVDRIINHNEEEEERPAPKPKVITAPSVILNAVEGFSFTLGTSGIHVSLPSAVQTYEPQTKNWPVGVILGLDFFQSAAWAQVSVEVDLEVCLGRTVALLTGNNMKESQTSSSGLDFDLVEPRRADHVEEDLRYYSRDGKVFWTPLWHLQLSTLDSCASLGQYLPESLPYPNQGDEVGGEGKNSNTNISTKCSWCSREFPSLPPDMTTSIVDWILSRTSNSGMVHCRMCEDEKLENDDNHSTYYCDSRCQRSAQFIHSLQRHKGRDLSGLIGKESKPRVKVAYILIAIMIALIGALAGPGWLFAPVSSNMPSAAQEVEMAVGMGENEL